jgi:hypothetical protein
VVRVLSLIMRQLLTAVALSLFTVNIERYAWPGRMAFEPPDGSCSFNYCDSITASVIIVVLVVLACFFYVQPIVYLYVLW